MGVHKIDLYVDVEINWQQQQLLVIVQSNRSIIEDAWNEYSG